MKLFLDTFKKHKTFTVTQIKYIDSGESLNNDLRFLVILLIEIKAKS